MKLRILLIHLLLCFQAAAAEWQWSVPVKSYISSETNGEPRAFLWIPENCKKVRAVIVGQHNMQEEGIMEHPLFRKVMRETGIAEIWISPGLSPLFNPATDSKILFEEILKPLAEISGYSELEFAPIIPIGHSAYATFPWTFAAWHPERTLAVLSVHGDAPRTHLTGAGKPSPEWGDRTTRGIPGLMIMGEYEWWEERLAPALDYKNKHSEAPVSLLADAGHGHFDHSDMLIEYLALFVKKAAHYRLPKKAPINKLPILKEIIPEKGWLKDRWYPDQRLPESPADFHHKYKGDKKNAFWYFDQEMAHATEAYYARARGKVNRTMGFVVNQKDLALNASSHAQYNTSLNPLNTALTFSVKSYFTDSSDASKITIERICGPVKKLDDSTFQIDFYRMGLNNKKRTSDIWLIAHHEGDKINKSSVQQLNLKFTYPKTEGKPQNITFGNVKNVSKKGKSIFLQAKSDSGLPVEFYVKDGPAKLVNGNLSITQIPPRSKLPIKVTVVAWQYGNDEFKSAEPVEQVFVIDK